MNLQEQYPTHTDRFWSLNTPSTTNANAIFYYFSQYRHVVSQVEKVVLVNEKNWFEEIE